MLKKVKNIFKKTDRFLYKKFGTDKSTKYLENIKEARELFSFLNDSGKEIVVRFVGGCVRKSLNGENVDDIDLATSLKTNDIKIKLNQKNIKIIETGVSHGTLTLILNKKKFEVTTLRKDISTDGRHANVEFTSDWKEDALRRDFTINAIYADIDGRIFDPLNGISDLKIGKIKFIGAAEERIQEDYLRILRYFRFFTQYSKSEHDEDVIKIIKKNINGLNKISNERIFDELKKILKLSNVYSLFSKESSKNILLNIFPQFKYYERLKKLNKLNYNLRENYDNNLILAILIIDETNDYEYFCHKYKTSNILKDRFNNISKNYNNFKNKKFYSETNIKKLIYLSNKDYVKDLLLFSICLNSKIDTSNLERLLNYVNECRIPKFPISGEFLKKYGYEPGKILGSKLKSLEEKWIENDFIINQKTIEKSLGKIEKN